MSTASRVTPGPRRPSGKPVRLDSLKNPLPRLPPQLKKPSRAQRAAASNECPNPDCHDKDVGEEDGQMVCRGCGTVVNESNMVSEVVFGASSTGANVLHGAFVGADQTFARPAGSRGGRAAGGMDSREVTEATGRRYINQLGAALTISQSLVDSGMQIFKLAAANNFIQGRRTKSVAAVCLYIACRIQKDTNRIMLIDFSDVLMLNVFKLGRIYKDLIDELRINGNGFTIHPINPEDLILRFAYRLEFGDETMRVANEAVRIVQRMNRDWMTPGRRPAGICGAALILAARMNNFRRTIREMVYIVKVTETTIGKRLDEFKVTESSGLTVEEFRTIDLERFCDPPAFYEQKGDKRKTRKRKVIEIEDGDSSGDESQHATSSNLSNGARQTRKSKKQALADSRTMPPPPIPIDPALLQVSAQRLSELQPSLSQEPVASIARSTTKKKRGRPRKVPKPPPSSAEPDVSPEVDLTSLITAPFTFASATALQRTLSSPTPGSATIEGNEPLTNKPNLPAAPPKPSRTVPSGPEISDSEFASDLEVENCLLTPAEVEIKERIWTHENADYLRTQQAKLLKQQIAEANGTARAIVKRTRRRGRMGDMSAYRDGDNDDDDGEGVASTPGEAAIKMLKKRGYSKKINYETLKKLYEPSTPSTAKTASNATSTAGGSRRPSDAAVQSVSSSSPAPSSVHLAIDITSPSPSRSPSCSPSAAPAIQAAITNSAPPPPQPSVISAAVTTNPLVNADANDDDEHEEGDPDFWVEGELEGIQEAIEGHLAADEEEEEDDDDDDLAAVEEEEFDYGGEEEYD